MELETLDIPEIAKSLAERHPSEIMQFALENFKGSIGISFSGAEDVVLVDLAVKIGGNFKVFSLDTGRLHSETYQFIDKVRDHYGIPVEIFFPQVAAVETWSRRKACSRFTRTATRSVAAFAKLSRSTGRLGLLTPGSPDSGATRALPHARRLPWWKSIPSSPGPAMT